MIFDHSPRGSAAGDSFGISVFLFVFGHIKRDDYDLITKIRNKSMNGIMPFLNCIIFGNITYKFFRILTLLLKNE